MAEDRIKLTHLMGKKLDKPLIMKWKSETETKKNKMEAVAKMFGKKLNEEFMARLKVGFEVNCKFTNEGLTQEIVDGDWYDNDNFLRHLLTGRAEIVEDKE